MSTILVTGGCGFIGINFVRSLLERESDVKVVNVDALTYAGNLQSLEDILDNPRHIFAHGNICDRAFINDLMREYNIKGIINFAAESHVDRSITGPEIFVDTNVVGTLVLLQAALDNDILRFLQVSTDEVYGSLGPEGLFTEHSPIQPNSPYSASKASADHLVWAFHHTYGMNTVITRCSNNYGPYQFPEKMIPLMINNARHDKPLPVYGDGLYVRDWLYVCDHCTAVWAAYKKGRPGSIYNIGGNNEKTNIAVIKEILSKLGKPESLITYVTDRLGHDRRYAINASKAKQELGWQPSVTFEEGLAMTLKWYVDNSAWLDLVTSGAYKSYYEQMYSGR